MHGVLAPQERNSPMGAHARHSSPVRSGRRELDSPGLDERQFPKDPGRRMRGNGVGAGGKYGGKDRLFV